MPYGKKWRDLLLPPHHPGEGVTDKQWENIFGSTVPKGKIAEEPHICAGCSKFKGKNCVFGAEKGSKRCKEVLSGYCSPPLPAKFAYLHVK